MVKRVGDIMITKVVSVRPEDSLLLARTTLRDYNIRHLPVVGSEDGHYLGVITQRDILSRDIAILRDNGFDQLQHIEASIPVSEVMARDAAHVAPDTPLTVAAQYFLDFKNDCLPVLQDGKLVGIVSPVDFVRLALDFLQRPD